MRTIEFTIELDLPAFDHACTKAEKRAEAALGEILDTWEKPGDPEPIERYVVVFIKYTQVPRYNYEGSSHRYDFELREQKS